MGHSLTSLIRKALCEQDVSRKPNDAAENIAVTVLNALRRQDLIDTFSVDVKERHMHIRFSTRGPMQFSTMVLAVEELNRENLIVEDVMEQ